MHGLGARGCLIGISLGLAAAAALRRRTARRRQEALRPGSGSAYELGLCCRRHLLLSATGNAASLLLQCCHYEMQDGNPRFVLLAAMLVHPPCSIAQLPIVSRPM